MIWKLFFLLTLVAFVLTESLATAAMALVQVGMGLGRVVLLVGAGA